jgi:hypothetical protein
MTRARQYKNVSSNYNITEEYLEKLNDYELKKVFLDVRSFLNRQRRNKANAKDLEIDFCYIQKEMQQRQERRRR